MTQIVPNKHKETVHEHHISGQAWRWECNALGAFATYQNMIYYMIYVGGTVSVGKFTSTDRLTG